MTALEQLLKNSISATEEIVVDYVTPHEKKRYDLTNIASKFNGAYCVKNSTICFVYDGVVYFTPLTGKKISTLNEAGLTGTDFGTEDIPLSEYGSMPMNRENARKWGDLCKEAMEERLRNYEDACTGVSIHKRVHPLDEEDMKRCLMIPHLGMPIAHRNGWRCRVLFPLCDEVTVDVEKLGKYNKNNGVVVFVGHNGRTYLTKGYKFTEILKAAGYHEDEGLYVPLSNGEVLLNSKLAEAWNNISKM